MPLSAGWSGSSAAYCLFSHSRNSASPSGRQFFSFIAVFRVTKAVLRGRATANEHSEACAPFDGHLNLAGPPLNREVGLASCGIKQSAEFRRTGDGAIVNCGDDVACPEARPLCGGARLNQGNACSGSDVAQARGQGLGIVNRSEPETGRCRQGVADEFVDNPARDWCRD